MDWMCFLALTSRHKCLVLDSIAENEDENNDELVSKTVKEKVNNELSSSGLHRTHHIH